MQNTVAIRNSFRLALLCVLAVFTALEGLYATHNKAGEITYRRIGTTGTTYEITITTYTDPTSTQADRCELQICYGDGKCDTIPRNNGCGAGGAACNCAGVIIVSGKVKMNTYTTRHTYAGPGTYTISMEDPNRVKDIHNIPNSVGIPFYLKTTLIISPTAGSNNSPVLNFPPVDQACLGQPFYHNPGAIDPDGDSLAYYLSICYGKGGAAIQNFQFPRAARTLEVNVRTGTLTWDFPLGPVGIYNVGILIHEYRRDINGIPQLVGTVLRDMQIDVNTCNNSPPIFERYDTECVIAGDSIHKDIVARDNSGQTLTLSAEGEALYLTNSPAVFTTPIPSADSIKGQFKWNTTCSHIQLQPYLTTFKAEDNAMPVRLVNFMTYEVTVIGPEPENLRTSAGKNSIQISWDFTKCLNQTGFKIYRRIDSTQWSPQDCETGVPSYTGYELIETIRDPSTRSYTDNNTGRGLIHGLYYCYRITATYTGNNEGRSSTEICDMLPFDTPIITRNSVFKTSSTQGGDSITFAKPRELNLANYNPPFWVKLYHKPAYSGADSLIDTFGPFAAFDQIDTVYRIEALNTRDNPNTFMFELFSGDLSMGESHDGASIYLSIYPDDRRLQLVWTDSTPWQNFSYIVYRETDTGFIALDTLSDAQFIDSGLVNLQAYKYYVKTLGRYSIVELPDTIVNLSQIQIGIPKDTIPPCPPGIVSIESDCELYQNNLSWSLSADTCNADAV
ncbi:MAG: fibronectin type III domain-containing protein, partial [Flavobacteriales bacterium]|nr:fibronectin type III domain-containing protein [Flavobacteriales bacterium]